MSLSKLSSVKIQSLPRSHNSRCQRTAYLYIVPPYLNVSYASRLLAICSVWFKSSDAYYAEPRMSRFIAFDRGRMQPFVLITE